jgi:hypothetical protein
VRRQRRVVDRGGTGQKGGRGSGRTGDAELPDYDAEGAVGVMVAVGRFLLGQTVDEDGTEGLVVALLGASGLHEEASGKGVVHGRQPEC